MVTAKAGVTSEIPARTARPRDDVDDGEFHGEEKITPDLKAESAPTGKHFQTGFSIRTAFITGETVLAPGHMIDGISAPWKHLAPASHTHNGNFSKPCSPNRNTPSRFSRATCPRRSRPARQLDRSNGHPRDPSSSQACGRFIRTCSSPSSLMATGCLALSPLREHRVPSRSLHAVTVAWIRGGNPHPVHHKPHDLPAAARSTAHRSPPRPGQLGTSPPRLRICSKLPEDLAAELLPFLPKFQHALLDLHPMRPGHRGRRQPPEGHPPAYETRPPEGITALLPLAGGISPPKNFPTTLLELMLLYALHADSDLDAEQISRKLSSKPGT